MHRAGPDHVDRGPLGHRVAGLDSGGDRIQLEEGEGRPDRGAGVHRHTIRSAPTTVIRRSREKVRGRVRPSPDGLAIENEQKPSPPSPRPAILGPFVTKMLQFIARAIFVIVSTSVSYTHLRAHETRHDL